MVANITFPIVEKKTDSAADLDPEFRIVEIFESLQGEGYNTGMPAIFIRLGRCDLACAWCDTDYLSYTHMPLSTILESIQHYSTKNIIITGGEPAIHPRLTVMLDALKALGYYLCIESNGLHQIPTQIDYIATSPKAGYAERYDDRNGLTQADEVRIVVDLEVGEEAFIRFAQTMAQKITANQYYLSPLEKDGQMNIHQTIRLLGVLNAKQDKILNSVRCQLSVQTHKWAGIE